MAHTAHNRPFQCHNIKLRVGMNEWREGENSASLMVQCRINGNQKHADWQQKMSAVYGQVVLNSDCVVCYGGKEVILSHISHLWLKRPWSVQHLSWRVR